MKTAEHAMQGLRKKLREALLTLGEDTLHLPFDKKPVGETA
jgi:hypothetical protein